MRITLLPAFVALLLGVIGSPASAATVPQSHGATHAAAAGSLVYWTRTDRIVECPVPVPPDPTRPFATPWTVRGARLYVFDTNTGVLRRRNDVETGFFTIKLSDGNRAVATRRTCDGTLSIGVLDLVSWEFREYTSSSIAGVLEETGWSNGAHWRWSGDYLVNWHSPDDTHWRIRRVDLGRGRLAEYTIAAHQAHDYFGEVVQAANGDLVWSRQLRRDQLQREGFPCGRRWLVYRWNATQDRPVVRVAFGPSPTRAPRTWREGDSGCFDIVLDPDTGTFRDEDAPLVPETHAPGGTSGAAWKWMRASGTPRGGGCCGRVRDLRTGRAYIIPAIRAGTGITRKVLGVGPASVVWHDVRGNGSQVGSIGYARITTLREAVGITSVRRRGARVTIRFRMVGTRYPAAELTRFAGEDRRCMRGYPGSSNCWFRLHMTRIDTSAGYVRRTPVGFMRLFDAPSGEKWWTRTSRFTNVATFVDPPGRQRYRLQSGGFTSRWLVL